MQQLHPRIRAALKKAEAAADEAARERRSHLTDAADPEPSSARSTGCATIS
ncbi:hypothetical protein ACFQY9_13340 [Microvirga aerilata]|uniref:hypothetical protein n=1 Tax=Microvirga aerilata TaxID=670292 RepID=UPI0036289C3B